MRETQKSERPMRCRPGDMARIVSFAASKFDWSIGVGRRLERRAWKVAGLSHVRPDAMSFPVNGPAHIYCAIWVSGFFVGATAALQDQFRRENARQSPSPRASCSSWLTMMRMAAVIDSNCQAGKPRASAATTSSTSVLAGALSEGLRVVVPGGISEKKIFRRRLESLSGFLESTALRGCPRLLFPIAGSSDRPRQRARPGLPSKALALPAVPLFVDECSWHRC